MSRVAIEYDTIDQQGYIPQVENLLQGMGHETLRVSSHDIIHGALANCDMVTFPGGFGAFEGLRIYGENFARCLQFFVASGGGYLGVCGGAYVAGANVPWLFGLYIKHTLRIIDVYSDVPPMLRFVPEYISRQTTRLLASVDISAVDYPITQGHQSERVNIVFSGGPILKNAGSSVTPLAYYYNGVLELVRGELAIAASQFGKGRVVISGAHPEAPEPVGLDVGEPVCRWLYEAMVNFCLQPATEIYFPAELVPWQVVQPLPSPAVAMAAVGAFAIGAVVGARKK